MTFAMIAAGALLATGGTTKPSTNVKHLMCERVYQFIIVPGGGVCYIPVPYVLMLPLNKPSVAKMPRLARMKNDVHIVIEAQEAEAKMKSFAQAMVEEWKSKDWAKEYEFTKELKGQLSSSVCSQKGTDPKQVIDPIVTGY